MPGPPVSHFVFLSMLLHALAIILFGAPSGGSREGRAMWGSLQVVLQGAPRDAVPTLKLDREPVAPIAPASPPRPRVAPRSKLVIPDAPLRTTKTLVIPDAPTGAAVGDPIPIPETTFPPLLDRIVPSERKLELPPPLQVPPPTEAPDVAPPREQVVTPEVAAPPAEVPLPVPERAATPPIERAPVEAPAIPVVPSTPPAERPPVEVQAIPVPPIESIAPPRSEPASKPVETAVTPSSPTPPSVTPSSPTPPTGATVGDPRTERPSPFRSPAPSTDSIDKYDPTAPTLDLDALRKRAGQIAREGTGRRAILPFPMPPVPERKSKMEIAIENARKPDCRTAYQALGLAAIVPLVANEFGEGNCRW